MAPWMGTFDRNGTYGQWRWPRQRADSNALTGRFSSENNEFSGAELASARHLRFSGFRSARQGETDRGG